MIDRVMPKPSPYGIPQPQFYRYMWDTSGIPEIQERKGVVIFTPQFENLVIYGRRVLSPYPEDRDADAILEARGRFMGEWFSTVCPEGEMGSRAYEDCEQISADEFSAAFQRGWKT